MQLLGCGKKGISLIGLFNCCMFIAVCEIKNVVAIIIFTVVVLLGLLVPNDF